MSNDGYSKTFPVGVWWNSASEKRPRKVGNLEAGTRGIELDWTLDGLPVMASLPAQLDGEVEEPEGAREHSSLRAVRTRKLTEKGLEYQRNLKGKTYHTALNDLRVTIDQIDMEWNDTIDTNILRDLRARLEVRRKDLNQAQSEYAALLSEEEVKHCMDESNFPLKQALELRQRIGEMIFELEREELRSVSGRSQVSRASRKSDSSSLRLKALAEVARRRVECKYAKMETQKRMEIQRKECEMEELKRAKEYERVKAEADAIVQLEREETDLTQETLGQAPVEQKVKEEQIDRYLASLPQHQAPQGRPLDPLCITEVVAECMQTARMPLPNLTVFSGNPLDWPLWKGAFEAVIEKRAVTSGEKILYLLQYLSGPPKRVIEGYQYVQSPNAYTEAKGILEKRFGHPSVVADAFRSKLEGWQKIPPRDGNALREFADFLKTCEMAMQSIEDLQTLGKQHENKKMLKTLPTWAHPKWGVKVREYQVKHGDSKFPPFANFVQFVNEIAEVQCLPVLSGLDISKQTRDDSKTVKERIGNRRSNGARTFSTEAKETSAPHKEGRAKACHWCDLPHDLNSCKEFMTRPIKERTRHIIKKGLCLRCLEYGHMAKENKCTSVNNCGKCNQPHPSCLHIEVQREADTRKQVDSADTNCTSVCNIVGQQPGQDQSLIVPVWVSSAEDPRNECLTYAILDCQSNATFISERLRQQLRIQGVESHLLLSTMHKENELVECRRVKNLQVTDFKRQVTIPLPKVFSRQGIPCKASQIPKPEVALQWEHLKCIAEELMPYREDVEVGLLIGANCPKALKPREVIPGEDNDPYAIRTDLGWGVVGRVCRSPQASDEVDGSFANRTVVDELDSNPFTDTNFAFESRAKEVFSPSKVEEMFQLDFHERSADVNPTSLSVEDRRFVKIMEEGIHKTSDGHYEMPLPLKSQNVELPNNRSQALRRLMHLKTRLERDPKYREDYVGFMEKMIENCAEEVPPQLAEMDSQGKSGRINYVAHHGVYHPKKPNKIRVVFDCSARYRGSSLNQNLLQGPDLTNNLVGVLCRFRREPVAFACDVEGMFHQFFVNEEDRDLLRFLWWKDNDLEARPTEYRMKVHLFGAASSPGCANFAFKKAADDGEAEFGAKAAQFVKQDFYVDDGLTSVKEPKAAIELIKSCQGLCAKAGLKLHKFVSNRKEVIQAIPPEDRAKGFQDIDLRRDPLPIERTLGVVWCVELDCFQFRIVVQDRPTTRRGVLSTVSSVYDPLGFVAPLTLVGKQMLQELCKGNTDWDDPIPDEMRPRWERWKEELHTIESLKIRRCYKPKQFGDLASAEMHHFSDASQKGYGQCSYLRLKDREGRVHCSFVMGKARVTPLKPVTIPRLELTAAVVAVRVSHWLKRELHYPGVVEHFWSDSQVVLGYIYNDARRFHVYVANRVQEVHEHTKPEQWHYVKTDVNPADAASRGLTARQLVHESRWLRGPEFLWEPVLSLPEPSRGPQTEPNDPEVKVSSLATRAEVVKPNYFETVRLDVFSDWFKAKKAIAICLRLKSRLRKGTPESHDKTAYRKVNLEEIARAEVEIIRCLQHEHFQEEIATLRKRDVSGEYVDRKEAKQRNDKLKKASNLYRLDPFLDEDQILRVGGRLRRAELPVDVKHPVILPRKPHVTKLIIRHCHDAVKHQGLGMTHNELRQRGYWVIGGVSAVSNLISKCVTCKKLRATVQQQKMADLPSDRMEPAPPFTYSAVDYFGPFVIKEGRKQVKRYGVLFTCMASRAIHIETANSLETDSFINALRRFLAERGPIRQIRSDRGTNFIGARRELREALDEMDQGRIYSHLLKENCEWIQFKMNVPAASHMGGVWERQIRSVRNVLAALLEESGSQLDDESFRTLMKEVQGIINSRPLTVIDSTSHELPQPLTPNHLLTMKSKVLMAPPGVFQREDLYSRRRWRRVQHLANQFWSRWRKEFLQTLQPRKKWIQPQRNLKIDDIVLVRDENLPRNRWRMARVDEVFPSDDGLVRKVKLAMATSELDKHGRRIHDVAYLERPIQKLVLILPKDQELPVEEPEDHQEH